MRLLRHLLFFGLLPGCESADAVQAVLEASNYCSTAEDCVSMGSYCPWGCNLLVNQDEVDAAWDAMDRYFRSHDYEPCEQVCEPPDAIVCGGGVCQVAEESAAGGLP